MATAETKLTNPKKRLRTKPPTSAVSLQRLQTERTHRWQMSIRLGYDPENDTRLGGLTVLDWHGWRPHLEPYAAIIYHLHGMAKTKGRPNPIPAALLKPLPGHSAKAYRKGDKVPIALTTHLVNLWHIAHGKPPVIDNPDLNTHLAWLFTHKAFVDAMPELPTDPSLIKVSIVMPAQTDSQYVVWNGGHGNSTPHPSTIPKTSKDKSKSKSMVYILDAITQSALDANPAAAATLADCVSHLKASWEPFVFHGGNHVLADHIDWLKHKGLYGKPLRDYNDALASSPFLYDPSAKGVTAPYTGPAIALPDALLTRLHGNGYITFGPEDLIGMTPALLERHAAKARALHDECIDHFAYLIFDQLGIPRPFFGTPRYDPTRVMISRTVAGEICGQPLIMMERKADGTFHTNAQAGYCRASTSCGVGKVTQNATGLSILDFSCDAWLPGIWHSLYKERTYFMTDRFRVKRTMGTTSELPMHYDIPITALVPPQLIPLIFGLPPLPPPPTKTKEAKK